MSFAYSVGAILLQAGLFPGQPPLFVQEYLGDPPFSNMSVARGIAPFHRAAHLPSLFFWPAVAAVAWAIGHEMLLIALGYLAFLPLVVAASHGEPGHTSHFVGILFVSISGGMHLASGRGHHRREAAWRAARAPLDVGLVRHHAGFVVCGAVKPLESGHMDLWRNLTTLPSLAREHATDRAVRYCSPTRLLVMLLPSGRSSSIRVYIRLHPIPSMPKPSSDPIERTAPTHGLPIDTFAYFELGPDIERVRDTSVMKDLTHEYRFKDTSIRLVSNRELDSVIGLERVPPEALCASSRVV